MAETLGDVLRTVLAQRSGISGPPVPVAAPPFPPGFDPTTMPMAGGDLSVQGGVFGGQKGLPPDWNAFLNYRKPF